VSSGDTGRITELGDGESVRQVGESHDQVFERCRKVEQVVCDGDQASGPDQSVQQFLTESQILTAGNREAGMLQPFPGSPPGRLRRSVELGQETGRSERRSVVGDPVVGRHQAFEQPGLYAEAPGEIGLGHPGAQWEGGVETLQDPERLIQKALRFPWGDRDLADQDRVVGPAPSSVAIQVGQALLPAYLE
jgi:hypothetical protein